MTKAPDGLHRKLVQIRQALNGAIEKTGENKRLKFAFAEAVEVGRLFIEEATPLNITMVPVAGDVVDIRPSATEKQLVVTVKVTWRITDADSGESIEVVSFGQGADNSDKAAPKAQTNAMKYGILMMLQTVADDPEYDDPLAEEASTRRPRAFSRNSGQEDDNLASLQQRRKVRAMQHEAGLSDEEFRAFAEFYVGRKSSKEWTKEDADKLMRKLADDKAVDEFRDEGDE